MFQLNVLKSQVHSTLIRVFFIYLRWNWLIESLDGTEPALNNAFHLFLLWQVKISAMKNACWQTTERDLLLPIVDCLTCLLPQMKVTFLNVHASVCVFALTFPWVLVQQQYIWSSLSRQLYRPPLWAHLWCSTDTPGERIIDHIISRRFKSCFFLHQKACGIISHTTVIASVI